VKQAGDAFTKSTPHFACLFKASPIKKKKEKKRTVETNLTKIVPIFSSDSAILVVRVMSGR
jgi:hypothetical protein